MHILGSNALSVERKCDVFAKASATSTAIGYVPVWVFVYRLVCINIWRAGRTSPTHVCLVKSTDDPAWTCSVMITLLIAKC